MPSLSADLIALFGAATAGATVSAAFFLVRLARDRSELRRALEALRQSARYRAPAAPLRFSCPEVSAMFRLTQSLLALRKSDEESRSTKRIMEAGASIATVADDTAEIAKAVGELVLERCAPYATAAAVVVREISGGRGEASLRFSRGIPSSRAAQILPMHFDALSPDSTSPAKWGYRFAEVDYAAFGVGTTLTVPLRRHDTLVGMIWIGFAARYSALQEDTLTELYAICEYCAACFESADRVRARLKERDIQRDQLLGISHDLRAPGNTALYSLRDLLSENVGALSTEQKVRLQVVEECLEDQLDMLGDFLDYARHQRGLLMPIRESIPIVSFLRRTLLIFEQQAASKGLQLIVSDAQDADVEADPRHVRRIVTNLVSNALKFTERGRVEISVRCDKMFATITVSDTGCGIDETERHLLFQEFSRLDGAAQKAGIGLGLAVARSLAELNGGTLRYEPAKECGSSFMLELPLRQEQARRSDIPFPRSILLIDDDPAVCRMNRRYLEGEGVSVFAAQTREEALDVIRAERPELIVTDLHLDDQKTGMLETLAFHRAPCLVLSGSPEEMSSQRFESDRFIRFLRKPVDREHLREAVSSLFRASRQDSPLGSSL